MKGNEGLLLITGGAGFIGTNLADRLLRQGKRVLILDNLSRPGVEHNLRWLVHQHGERLQVMTADIRDPHAVREAVSQASGIFHLAAQVAVTTSLSDPGIDFEINARGTLNLLEAVRALNCPPPLIFTSTNKVYGELADIPLIEQRCRYSPKEAQLYRHGVSERRPLSFHSPYGCSKGAADQYVLDYARSYGLPALVFRMSCIYGQHQYGTEDQGWVAHFLIRALAGQSISLYGSGKQVRDILYIDDLVNALLLAREHIATLKGQAFNIGGGASNTISLLELIQLIGELHGAAPGLEFGAWRVGDQRYYVSDSRAFQAATGWVPQTGVRAGVNALYRWLRLHRGVSAATGTAGVAA